MHKQKKYISRYVEVLGALFLFVIVFQVTCQNCYNGPDYGAHLSIAKGISGSDLLHFGTFLQQHCYPLWHILIRGILKVTMFTGVQAAGIVSAVCYTVMYLLTVEWIRKCDVGIHHIWVSVWTFLLYVAGPIYIPWYNSNVYIGQDSPNVWHNPTHIMVKPIALAAFILILHMVTEVRRSEYRQNIDWKEGIGAAILLTAANLAKPSFVQILYPALVLWMVYYLVVSRGKALKMGVQLAVVCIPAFLLLIFQFAMSFYAPSGEGGGIEISFLEYWRSVSPNVGISILLVVLFPLAVLVLAIRRKGMNDALRLSWLMLLCGAGEKALLIESGGRRYHGNFCWGYSLGIFFVWAAAIRYFCSYFFSAGNWTRKKKIEFTVLLVILLLHLCGGAYYLYQLLFIEGFSL